MKDNLGWIVAGVILLIIVISCVLSGGKKKESENVEIMDGKHNVVIKVKNYGDIYLELDADIAPITVTNFIYLVNKNFYDGLTFHRIIKGFMLQGGDPSGNGTGGSATTIKGEFVNNGVENSISHERGVISMARSSDMNSASSQFFIVHKDSKFLDGDYAAFGHVTKGMEVVDKIVEEVGTTEDTLISKSFQPVIESIKVVEE